MWLVIIPFLVALGAVILFGAFAFLAQHYHRFAWSRLFMWVGILVFLAGCWLFGSTVYRLPLGWMTGAVAFFVVLFGVVAGYFLRRRRRQE